MLIILNEKALNKLDDAKNRQGNLCKRLPNNCRLESYQEPLYTSKSYLLVCNRLEQDFKFDFDRFISKKDCNG